MAEGPPADDAVAEIRSLLAHLNDEERARVLAALPDDLRATVERDWPLTVARQEQLPPPGDWLVWLLLAGRGFGKTRSGAEWVRAQVESGRAGRIALVAPTAADARDVMIEGESGILAVTPDPQRPLYEPSRRRLCRRPTPAWRPCLE